MQKSKNMSRLDCKTNSFLNNHQSNISTITTIKSLFNPLEKIEVGNALCFKLRDVKSSVKLRLKLPTANC